MKKTGKIIFKTLISLVIIGGLGFGGYTLYKKNQTQGQASVVRYTPVTISTGNIEKSVSGTGSLSISKTQSITLDFPVQIDEVYIRNGEQVAAGDALMKVNQTALETTIKELEEEYNTSDQNIASTAKSYSNEENIKSTAAGRIKALYGEEGDRVLDVMANHGAIALLSLDGKMNVTVRDNNNVLAVGDSVTVYIGSGSYKGEVQKIDNGQVLNTFSDASVLEGETVTVKKNGEEIGTGQAHINIPFYVTSSVDGRITSVVLEVNNTVSTRSTLYKAGQIPIPAEYSTLVQNQETLKATIENAKALLGKGIIASTIDGIVNSTVEAGEMPIEKNTALASLYIGDSKEMVVSIDELDIISVQVGQAVSIAMDAVTDKTYEGTVSYISQIGSSSSGVTTYSVTIDVQGDEYLKLGMNGTATIKIETVKDVPLVPITALNSSINGQYVWLYDESKSSQTQGTQTETADTPGILTYVTTGLSDANYAQVVSGLSEGDQVLITRTAASSSATGENAFAGGMDPSMFMGGGEMPSMPVGGFEGGGFPSGGFPGSGERPTGGGNGGGRPSGGGNNN